MNLFIFSNKDSVVSVVFPTPRSGCSFGFSGCQWFVPCFNVKYWSPFIGLQRLSDVVAPLLFVTNLCIRSLHCFSNLREDSRRTESDRRGFLSQIREYLPADWKVRIPRKPNLAGVTNPPAAWKTWCCKTTAVAMVAPYDSRGLFCSYTCVSVFHTNGFTASCYMHTAQHFSRRPFIWRSKKPPFFFSCPLMST